MSNRVPATDLDELHDAILAGLRAGFSEAAIPTIAAYGRPGEAITTPALFLELDGIEPDPDNPDTGTDQMNVVLPFTLHVVVSYKGQSAQQRFLRRVAGAVTAFIRGKKWSTNVGPAELEPGEPGEFQEKAKGYYTWLIHFNHTAVIDPAFDVIVPPTEVTPGQVMLGEDPLIGPTHEPDYKPVENPNP